MHAMTQICPTDKKLDFKSWALEVIEAGKNQYMCRMDCATMNALYRIANGEVFNFVASRYTMDSKEALSIITEDAGVNGICLGNYAYVPFTSLDGLYKAFKKNANTECIAVRTDSQEKIHLRAYGIEGWMRWHKDPQLQITQHIKWKNNEALYNAINAIVTTYAEDKILPSKDTVLQLIDIYINTLDKNSQGEIIQKAQERKNEILGMTEKDVQTKFLVDGRINLMFLDLIMW